MPRSYAKKCDDNGIQLAVYVKPLKVVDKICQDKVYLQPVVKSEFNARREIVSTKMVDDAWRAFENEDFSRVQQLEILSEMFMALHQKIELGKRLLSEIELKAPPATLWKQRDKSRKLKPQEHIEEQFSSRIGRGFERKHLKVADPELYAALSQWLHRNKQLAPVWLTLPDNYEPCLADPLSAIAEVVSNRRRIRKNSQKPKL